ncbi:hypothetical protein EJF36_18495 [Bacillus sp. HMF5848]|uniref:hypothetical protein n=1 Tax=Bacillus sp. HMF5848 TaxID=2495421 RepID=UPI000F77B5A5|nr:hypothetical protein [Bacillus sp. HMF5848]RSK28699.1 hypothetical protein EJF36_18495 [Bacillus sp. HMF5848]
MITILEHIADFINASHNFILNLSNSTLQLSDKELHFWVIGIGSIVFFIIVDLLFRYIAKWTVTALSFIYAFTVVFFLVIVIEIEQGITNNGNVEVLDAALGLAGFLAFFILYVFAKGLYIFSQRIIDKVHEKKYFN